jgi:hypothetical protein
MSPPVVVVHVLEKVTQVAGHTWFEVEGLATEYTVEGGLRHAALSELGQRFNAEREMIGLDVKVYTVLVAKPLVKREMPRPIAVFVEPEGANGSFSQRLRD